MTMKVTPKFMRNVTKSLGYATTSAFGDLMPTLRDNMRNNQSYVASVYSTTRERLSPEDIQKTWVYKSAQSTIKNMVEDARSGNWFNKDRANQAENDSFSEMFGLDIDSLFDGMDSDGNASSSSESETDGGNTLKQSNVLINQVDTGLNETVGGGLSRLANLNAQSTRLSVNQGSTISKQISTMIEFNQSQTIQFYNDVSSRMADMASNVSQMTGFMGVMAEVSVGGTRGAGSNSMLQNLLGVEGLDISGIKDMYKSKVQSNGGGMLSLIMMAAKPMIEEIAANPIGTMLKLGVRSVLPKSMKSAMGEFNQLLRFLPTMAQGKFQNWKNSDNGMLRQLGEALSVDLSDDKRMDFSRYEKGRVSFDGITRRSIVNVIPGYLSRILSAVSKDSVEREGLVYDFDRGGFTTRKRVRDEMDEDMRNFSIDNFDIKKYKEQIITQLDGTFGEDSEMSEFMEKIDQVMNEMVDKATILTGNTKTEDLSKNPELTEAAQAILDTFNGMQGADRAKVQNDFLTAAMSKRDIRRRAQENEWMNTAFDLLEPEAIHRQDTNADLIRKRREFQNSIFGEEDLYVENNMSKRNPLYWATQGIRGLNQKVVNLLLNEDSPADPQEKKSSSFMNKVGSLKDKVSNSNIVRRGKDFAESYSKLEGGPASGGASAIPLFNNQNQRSQEELTTNVNEVSKEIGGKEGLTENVVLLTDAVQKNTRAIAPSSSASRAELTNVSFDSEQLGNLKYLPEINDGVLHIAHLLEAKMSGEGLPVGRIGKFRGTIGTYKDKALGFLDRFFTRERTPGGRGMMSRVAGRFRKFFDFVGNRQGGRDGGGLLSSLFGGRNGRDRESRSLMSKMFGKDGMVTGFFGNLFTIANDALKEGLPKAGEFAGNMATGAGSLIGKVLTGMGNLGRRGLNRFGEMRENRRERRRNRPEGEQGLFGRAIGMGGSALGGLGSILSGGLGLAGKGIGLAGRGIGGLFTGAGNLFSSLGGRRGRGNEDRSFREKMTEMMFFLATGKRKNGGRRSEKEMKDSPEHILKSVFNRKLNALHVYTKTDYDMNSAEAQIAEFERSRKERALTRTQRNKSNIVLDEEKGFFSSLMGMLGNLGGFLPEILGLTGAAGALGGIGRRFRNRRNPNTRAGRRAAERRAGRGGRRRGLLGKVTGALPFGLGGAGAASADDGSYNDGYSDGVADATGGSAAGGGLDALQDMGGDGRERQSRSQRRASRRGGRRGLGRLTGGIKGMFNRGGSRAATAGIVSGASDAAGETLSRSSKKAGGKGLLKGGLKAAGRASRFIPGLGLITTAGMGIADSVSGFNNAGEAFDTADPTLGQKLSSGAGGLLSGLSFGLLDKNKMAQGIHGAGSGISEFFKKGFASMKEKVTSFSESSNDPAIRTAAWIEKVGKFFTVGAGGSLLGGLWGTINGATGGIFGKVGNWFKGLFSGVVDGIKGFFGGDKESSGGSSEYTGNIGEGIGALSHKYESGGDPGVVANNAGDIGGQSFGMYQLSRKMGSLKTFISNLDEYGGAKGKEWQQRLNAAYSSESATKSVWQAIAKEDPKGFAEAQDNYAIDKYFKPAAAAIKNATGFDVGSRSTAVQAALLSTSIQHGSGGAKNVWSAALKGDGSGMSDADIIEAVYNERGANNGMKYFPSSSASIRSSVVSRFKREKQDALAMLKKDGGKSSSESEEKKEEDSGSSSASKGGSESKPAASMSHDQFYQDPGSTASKGTSSGTAGFEGGPNSTYSTVGGFKRPTSVSGSSLPQGQTYVGNWNDSVVTGNSTSGWVLGRGATSSSANLASQNDSRWSLVPGSRSSANVSNSQNDLRWRLGMGLESGASSSTAMTNQALNTLLNNSYYSGTTSNSSNGTVVNRTASALSTDAERLGDIQSLLRQINQTGQEGNETLGQILEALLDMKDTAKEAVTSRAASAGSIMSGGSSSMPFSQEFSGINQGY
jgi:hypothetical protein